MLCKFYQVKKLKKEKFEPFKSHTIFLQQIQIL